MNRENNGKLGKHIENIILKDYFCPNKVLTTSLIVKNKINAKRLKYSFKKSISKTKLSVWSFTSSQAHVSICILGNEIQ